LKNEIEKIILTKAKKLQRIREIIRYTPINDWREPEFVVNVHELGTICAQELRMLFESNPDVYQSFQE